MEQSTSMPRKPKGPCNEPGCPALATYRGRCKTHARAQEVRRGTRQQRGLGRDHEILRAQTLREEKHCWICGEGPRPNDPLEADHVTARANGGTNVRSNYRAAHASCNRRQGARVGGTPRGHA